MKATLLFSMIACVSVLNLHAQQPASKLTAVSVNVAEPGQGVRIDINRWSTDKEREQLLTTMNPPSAVPAAPAPAAATRGDTGRGARGGARGARGGRGGGGGGGGGAAAADPIRSLTAAVGKAQTLGYIWTNEATGYSIKYAQRLPLPGGGERIVLVTDRRIGAYALAWQPASGTPTAYEFTVLDIRLNPAGSGEAKASLTASVALDNESNTIGLENYTGAPTLLEKVKHR